MKSGIQTIVVSTFLCGLLLTGLLGTATSMTFVWPGYLLLGLAGLLSISVLFQSASFHLPKWTTISVFLLVFYLLSRAADSPVAYFAREDAMMIIACVIVYAAFLSLCTSAKWRRGVALAFAGLVLANLGFAALQMTMDASIWLVPGYGRTITNGIGGLFNQPDHFAIFLAALVPLWLGLCFLGRESRTFRFFWISLAVISVLFLAISGSVSGWLTLLAGGICFAALAAFLAWDRLRFSKRRLLLISGSLVALMLILTVSYGSGAILRNVGHGLLADGSAGAMPSLWKSGLKQVVESPIVGTGSRSSQIYGRLFRGEELGTGASEPQFLHNEYLQVLADYGIFGLTLVLALLAVHFFYGARFLSSFRAIRPARGERIAKSNHLALCVGAFSALVALAGAACFDFILHLPVVAVLASFLLAILAVPDPMSQLDKKVGGEPLIPGGSLLFGVRAIGFGGGLVLLGLGAVFVQSEYHFEMARKGVERGDRIYLQYRHLQNARELDPRNPFIQTLSAHAQVGSIESDMPLAERRQALEKADLYFSTAQQLYPQDVFAAMGHVAVLDELGKRVRARERLREAREWAPLYGNLMRAEAEHYLRNGQIGIAQEAFSESLQAPAFRDEAASREGLGTVSEWKLIALQNGIPLDALESDGSGNEMRRIFPDAVVDERAVAGQASPSQ